MYNMMTVVNPAVFGMYMKVVERVFPKNSHYKDKFFCLIFIVLNLLP